MQNYFDNEATSSALHATMKPARSGKCLVTLSTYEDRKEALLNTTIMEDSGTYRSKASKNNITKPIKQQNDETDHRESKKDTTTHIPKPPPLQMASSSSNTYKNNNNNKNTQATYAASNSNNNKSFAMNDQDLTNNSQIAIANDYSDNDTYSRPNKTPAVISNGNNTNRQTLRLGSVTIGEYRQQNSRREPEKFDFISTQRKSKDAGGDTTPTNEALQSELQNTLSRANLRKSNGNSYVEHQRNCPLHQQQQQQQLQQRHSIDYGNNVYAVDEMSKKLQKSSLYENSSSELLAKTNNRSATNTTGTIGAGILKNGNRTGTSSSSKSTEKSIKFG